SRLASRGRRWWFEAVHCPRRAAYWRSAMLRATVPWALPAGQAVPFVPSSRCHPRRRWDAGAREVLVVAFAARDFPKTVGLRDGAAVPVRPLASTDTVKLWDFFSALPEPDRYFMKDDVLDPATTARWTSKIDHDRAL